MEQKWYVADLLFAQPEAEPSDTVLCESCSVLLKADHGEHAYERALEWARAHEQSNEFGMSFLGVRHLHRLQDPPGDGCEVGGGFFEEMNVWKRRDEFIPAKDEIPVLVLERNPQAPIGDLICDETKQRLRKLLP